MCQIGVGRAYNDVCILATPVGRTGITNVKLEYKNVHSGSNAHSVNAAGDCELSQNGFQFRLHSLRASPSLERTTLPGQGGLGMF